MGGVDDISNGKSREDGAITKNSLADCGPPASNSVSTRLLAGSLDGPECPEAPTGSHIPCIQAGGQALNVDVASLLPVLKQEAKLVRHLCNKRAARGEEMIHSSGTCKMVTSVPSVCNGKGKGKAKGRGYQSRPAPTGTARQTGPSENSYA